MTTEAGIRTAKTGEETEIMNGKTTDNGGQTTEGISNFYIIKQLR
jgi:hypothetical protein